METDIAPVDPSQGAEVNFNGLRPDPYAPREPEERPPTPQQQEQEPSQDDYYYYNDPHPPPPPPTAPPPTPGDIFSNMDRTTWILLVIAFVVGFFMGRGMIQPIILRSGH